MNPPVGTPLSLRALVLIAALLVPCAPSAGAETGAGGIADRLRAEWIGRAADSREAKGEATAPAAKGGTAGDRAGVPAERAAEREAELEAELAKIRALAPGIDAPDPERPIPFAAGDPSRESLADLYAAERRELYRARFAAALALRSSGAHDAAREAFVALHDDFPAAAKPSFFAILSMRDGGRTAAALEAARQLRELLAYRATRLMLRAELDLAAGQLAERTDPVELTPAQRRILKARFDRILDEVKRLHPGIAALPDPPGKQEAVAGDEAARLRDKIERLRRAEVREALARAHKSLAAGRLDEAYAAYDAVREDRPNVLRALYGMALCRRKAGRPDEAAALAADLLAQLRVRGSIREERADLDAALASAGSATGEHAGAPLQVRFVTYNVNFARSAERVRADVAKIAPHADVLMFQEAKFVVLDRFLGPEWTVVQEVAETDAKQGTAIAIRRSILARTRGEGLTFGVDNRGAKMHDRYIAWVDAELVNGRILRLLSAHMPPARFGHLQPPMAENLVEFVRKSPHPVVAGGDWNFRVEKDPHGIGERSGLVPRGAGIDGFFRSAGVVRCLALDELKGLKVSSDHDPVRMVARVAAP